MDAKSAPSWLKFEPGFASCICKGFYPPMIKKPITVKHHFVDSSLATAFGDGLSDQLCRRDAAFARYLVAQHRRDCGRGNQCAASLVRNHLGVNMVQRPVDRKPR